MLHGACWSRWSRSCRWSRCSGCRSSGCSTDCAGGACARRPASAPDAVSALSARVGEIRPSRSRSRSTGAASYFVSRMTRRLDCTAISTSPMPARAQRSAQGGALVMDLTQVAVLLVGGYLVIASDGQDLARAGWPPSTCCSARSSGRRPGRHRPSGTGRSRRRRRAGGRSCSPTRRRRESADAVEIGPLQHEIGFEDVSFGYRRRPDRPARTSVSPSGPARPSRSSGRPAPASRASSICCPACTSPSSGASPGTAPDMQDASLASLRRQIALVPQDAALLAATVYENIRFGLDSVSEAEVRRAADLAQAHRVHRAPARRLRHRRRRARRRALRRPAPADRAGAGAAARSVRADHGRGDLGARRDDPAGGPARPPRRLAAGGHDRHQDRPPAGDRRRCAT